MLDEMPGAANVKSSEMPSYVPRGIVWTSLLRSNLSGVSGAIDQLSRASDYLRRCSLDSAASGARYHEEIEIPSICNWVAESLVTSRADDLASLELLLRKRVFVPIVHCNDPVALGGHVLLAARCLVIAGLTIDDVDESSGYLMSMLSHLFKFEFLRGGVPEEILVKQYRLVVEPPDSAGG